MKPGHHDGQAVDLSNCDREPIHVPGRIQGHGALFALREPDLAVVQASGNAPEVIGFGRGDLLGLTIDRLVAAGDAERCRRWLQSPGVREAGPIRLAAGTRVFDATAHRHDGVLILELENGGRPEDACPTDYRPVRTAMGRLQAADSLSEFCRVAAEEMRTLTGFDRVIVYRFDADWNGQVYGEARRDDLAPLLGLHFPAGDIPEPARKLYHLNKIRLIADADAQAVPLIPGLNPLTGRPLDLTFSVLRSVSPVHIQYLKNMGAHASMSVSLLREGRLWGLLSCMHYSGPRYVTPGVRDACEFLGQVVSAQLAVKEDSEGHQYRGQLQAVRERLLQRMSAEGDLVRGLPGDDLLALTGAAGAAIAYDGSCMLTGTTPTEEQVKRLVAWLRVHAEGEVFHTDSLARLYPEAAEFKDVASGLVAIATTKVQGHYVLWFRPEVVQTVNWGGDPRKPVEHATPSGELSPRRSFELWREEVRLKCLPWRQWEVDAARLLRDAIIAVVVRRAEELTRLNAELERSNSDLDAFAFITSHDLKEPLRGINNYATFLMEDYEDRLDDEGKDKLRTLVRLSQRLEDIVESLLAILAAGAGRPHRPADRPEPGPLRRARPAQAHPRSRGGRGPRPSPPAGGPVRQDAGGAALHQPPHQCDQVQRQARQVGGSRLQGAGGRPRPRARSSTCGTMGSASPRSTATRSSGCSRGSTAAISSAAGPARGWRSPRRSSIATAGPSGSNRPRAKGRLFISRWGADRP